jgi:hypothetical protein
MADEEQKEYEKRLIAAIEERNGNFEPWAHNAIARHRSEQAVFGTRTPHLLQR